MTKGLKYSVVIPVYNTSACLPELFTRIRKVFEEEVKSEYEVIFIDDGSINAETGKTLVEIYSCYNLRVKVVFLTTNFGQQAATLCGLSQSTGNYIITMDDDLQHAPEDIPLLIRFQHHDVVIGYFKNKNQTLKQKFFSFWKKKLDEWLLGKPPSVRLSSFRLLKRSVKDCMMSNSTQTAYIPALLLNCTKDIVNVEVEHGKRKEGFSGYTWSKAFQVFLSLLKSQFYKQKKKKRFLIDKILGE